MSAPTDALSTTVFCGDLRREPDGRWFFGSLYLGQDGEVRGRSISTLDDRRGVRLAEAFGQTRDAMDGLGAAARTLAQAFQPREGS